MNEQKAAAIARLRVFVLLRLEQQLDDVVVHGRVVEARAARPKRPPMRIGGLLHVVCMHVAAMLHAACML